MGSYGRWGKGNTKELVCGGRCGLIRALGAWLATVTSDSRGQCGDMKEEGARRVAFSEIAMLWCLIN